MKDTSIDRAPGAGVMFDIVARAARVAVMAVIMAFVTAPTQLVAQAAPGTSHRHDASHAHGAPAQAPTPAPGAADARRLDGQAAFATVAEVVRLLDMDRGTDWSKVDLERLRRHLADMDLVTLRTAVARVDVPGGARFTVRGDTGTLAAAGRLARGHAPLLRAEQGYAMTVEDAPDAIVVTVTAGDTTGAANAAPARIRALGFVGLLATGDHHATHHVAIARGAAAGAPGAHH